MRFVALRFTVLSLTLGTASYRLAAANDPRSPTLDVTVVDEADRPVEGASLRFLRLGGDGPIATSDASGLCRIERPVADEDSSLRLLASDASGRRQASFEWEFRDPVEARKPLRIVLAPAREVTVRVVDHAGSAVGEALVVALYQGFNVLDHARTDRDGVVRLRTPASALPSYIIALKSGVGFDAWGAVDPDQFRHEVPPELSFRLEGAQTIRVRAVDRAGKPVAGVAIFPMFVARHGTGARLDWCRPTDAITDRDGVATVDWLPLDWRPSFDVAIHSAEYVPLLRSLTAPGSAEDGKIRQMVLPLLRRTKISGRVVDADGKPAAGVVVRAQGRNAANRDHRDIARTAADGTWSMNVAPGLRYGVGIVDDQWAAATRVGIEVVEGEPLEGIDFELIEGTLIRGTVTPAGLHVYLIQTGPDAAPPDRSEARLFLSRFALSDADGRYRMRAPPGEYRLLLSVRQGAPRVEVPLKVTDEREIVRDLVSTAPPPRVRVEPGIGLLTGTVVGPDGAPVPEARIRGSYSGSMTQLTAAADAAGKFQAERKLLPLRLFAVSPDGKLGGQTRVAPEGDSCRIELTPTATVVGRLVDGELPVAGASVKVSMQLPYIALDSTPRATAADGRFVVPGLIVGETYGVVLGGEVNNRRTVRSVKVDRPGVFDLGFIDAPARHEVSTERGGWRPIDVQARLLSRFEIPTDVATRVSEAIGDARRENRRVLLVLGDPSAPVTRSAFEILDRLVGAEDYELQLQLERRKARADRDGPLPEDELKRTMADYLRVHIDLRDRNAVAWLTQTYRVDLARLTPPALVLLGEEGRPAAIRWFGTADDPPRLNAEALTEFVKEHALPFRDAEALLAAALLRARDENKRVLLQQCGTDSYPTRLLGRFLDRHRDLLDRDYVLLSLDTFRTAKGEEVIHRFRQTRAPRPPRGSGEPAGDTLPWMAILDAEGTKLADSDGPEGNIAYPAEPAAADYFIDRMLAPTARRLATADLERLRRALNGQ